jgi:alanyl-tRNA synthetase
MADKSLNEIRNTFLKYFEKNDHKIVESSNLGSKQRSNLDVCKFRDGSV